MNDSEIAEQIAEIKVQSRFGTQHYWKTWAPKYLLTDGVLAVCDTAQCHWLVDVILSHQTDKEVRKEPCQFWKLESTGEDTARLICTDGDRGTGPITLATQAIPYTDFPKAAMPFEIWLHNHVLLLPDEY